MTAVVSFVTTVLALVSPLDTTHARAADPDDAGAAVVADSASGWPIAFSFEFRGLRTEIQNADAIVRFTPVPPQGSDSIEELGLQRTARGVVRTTFRRHRELWDGDTLTVSVAHDRHEQERQDLDEQTGQSVWSTFPTGPADAIVLLRRDGHGWEATRSLHPDSLFVAAYVHAATLPNPAAARTLMRMFLAEYSNNSGTWGHVRVLWDDLRRLEATDSRVSRIVNAELSRVDLAHGCLGRVLDHGLLADLAPRFPASHRRKSVRKLLLAYDQARGERREPESRTLPTGLPREMTPDLSHQLSVTTALAVIPETLRLLLPRELARSEDPADVVEHARRWIGR